MACGLLARHVDIGQQPCISLRVKMNTTQATGQKANAYTPEQCLQTENHIDRTTSLYLDTIRFMAAMAVFLFHAANKRFFGVNIPIFSWYGSEAVAVFFVVSGYVIEYVTETKEKTATSYFKARAVRIYSVIVPALLLTYVLDSWGSAHNPSYYNQARNYSGDHSPLRFLQIISLTGEILNQHFVFGSNEPLWSIGFECLYYLEFGILIFWKNNASKLFAIALILLGAPKITLYFPLWLFGVAVRKKGDMPSTLFIPSLLIIGLLPAIGIPHQSMFAHIDFSGRMFTSILYFNLIGLAVAINIASSRNFLTGKNPLKKLLFTLEYPIRWLARKTFSIYVMHLPFMMFFCSQFVHAKFEIALIEMAITLAFCIIFSEIFESKNGLAFSFYRSMGNKIRSSFS